MHRTTLLVLLGLGLLACGGGSRSGPDEPIPVRLGRGDELVARLQGRRCEYVESDGPTATFGELARPGTRGNIALWGRHQLPADTVELSVRYGDDGRLVWARAIRSTLPLHRTSPLEQLMLQSIDEVGRPDWGFRVDVVGGDVAGTAPSVICPADMRRGGVRQAVPIPRTRSAINTLRQMQGLPFDVLISLDERGRVLHVELPRTTGDSSVDHFIISWVMETDFAPKLHDGIPVATTIRETITIPRRF